MDRLCEELLLLAIDAGRGSLGRIYGISYGLMAAELIQLATRGRIDIADNQILVTDTAPTGDLELDAALARIGESDSPPRPGDWVARPRPRISGKYLERLAAAGVVRQETRLWATRWHITDHTRLAEARGRLDIIAASGEAVDVSQSAYAGLVCAVGLDRLLYRGRAGRGERERLREIAKGRRTGSPAAAADSADPTQAAGRAVAQTAATTLARDDSAGEAAWRAGQAASDAASLAAVHAATRAAVDAVAYAAASAAHSAGGGGHGGGHHGGH